MLFGVPPEVKAFFRPVLGKLSKPIRRALPLMVLAWLLAPHRRSLKTVAGTVLGRREHVSTLSRRLRNRRRVAICNPSFPRCAALLPPCKL